MNKVHMNFSTLPENTKQNPKEVLRKMVNDGVQVAQKTTEKEYQTMKDNWQSDYKTATKRFTSHCPIEIQERLRNMCFWTRIPISDYFVHALENMLDEFESNFNEGTPWKQRPQEVPQGRPAGR